MSDRRKPDGYGTTLKLAEALGLDSSQILLRHGLNAEWDAESKYVTVTWTGVKQVPVTEWSAILEELKQ